MIISNPQLTPQQLLEISNLLENNKNSSFTEIFTGKKESIKRNFTSTLQISIKIISYMPQWPQNLRHYKLQKKLIKILWLAIKKKSIFLLLIKRKNPKTFITLGKEINYWISHVTF